MVGRKDLLHHLVFVLWLMQSSTEVSILGEGLLCHLVFFVQDSGPLYLVVITLLLVVAGVFFSKFIFSFMSSCIRLSLLVKGEWLKLKRKVVRFPSSTP